MQDSSTACNSSPLHRARIRLLLPLAIILLFSAHALAADRYSDAAVRVKALDGTRFGHVLQLGKSGKGRPIYAVVLADSRLTHPAETRVLVISGQHGDEVSPVYAMLDLAEQMAHGRNPKLAALLQKTAMVIVPVVNPDGFASGRRYNSRMADLNRSWRSGTQPEICSVQSLVDSFRPQVVVDLHEWMDRNPLHTNCVEVAGFGSGPQRRLSRLLSAFTRHEMIEHSGTDDIRTVFYHKEADSRLAHRHFAGQGICSMLVETASGQPREARMRIYREFVTATVRTLAQSNDPRITAQLAALSRSVGAPDPDFARMREHRPVVAAGVGDISCWIVIVAATAYILVRSMGSRRRSSETPAFGRSSSMRPQINRLPLTEVVQANLPLRARVALIQQQRVRPSDRGKSAVGMSKAA